MPDDHRAPAYKSIANAVEDLTRRGFTEQFQVVEGQLRALGTGKTLKSEDIVIREYHRFEGVSDPDDMAVVYAIESKDGVRGTLADAFGTYSNPGIHEALKDVPIRDE